MRTPSINAETTRNIMLSHNRRAATRSHWLRKFAVERQMARCQKRCEKKNTEKMPRTMTKRTTKKAQFTKEIPRLPDPIVTRWFYLTCNGTNGCFRSKMWGQSPAVPARCFLKNRRICMTKIRKTIVLLFVITGLCAWPSFAQQAQQKSDASKAMPSSSQIVLAQWNEIGRKLIAMADDFPDGKYDFKPTPPMRSFAEQLLHAAGSMEYFTAPVQGKP